tara:strand:- start:365 stop:583 length:219 start_codon:yes stop_codon:yes gene_type:complete
MKFRHLEEKHQNRQKFKRKRNKNRKIAKNNFLVIDLKNNIVSSFSNKLEANQASRELDGLKVVKRNSFFKSL